jgi:hypothetical protein
MGQLGKCPTCNEPISTSARRCPHCGEDDFHYIIISEKARVCPTCNGTAKQSSGLFDSGYSCNTCDYAGKVLIRKEKNPVTNEVIGVIYNSRGSMIGWEHEDGSLDMMSSYK